MKPQDCYLKLTAVNKKPTFSAHRVWDIDRFLASQIEQNSGTNVKPEDKRDVQIITEKQYLKGIK